MELSLEKIKAEKRVKTQITLAESIFNTIKGLCENIIDEKGRKYKISWFIEDLILYVFSDKKRFDDFMDTFYEEIVEDEQQEES